MKKRITAFLVATALLFTVTVFSAYYPEDIIRADIPFSEMLEYEYDFEGSLKNLKKAEKKLDDGAKIDEILFLIDKALPSDSIDYMTRCTLDSLVASINNSPENSKRLTESENYALDIHNLTMKLVKRLFEAPQYKADFVRYMETTDDEIREIIEAMPTDKEYEIQKQLNELSEEYYNSTFGSYEMEYEGKKYTLETLTQIPQKAYAEQFARYISESCDILSEIFIKIAKKRLELSEAAGYESYADYAYTEEYPKDYSASDRQSFYEYTAEYIVPLYNELYDTLWVFADEDIAPEISLTQEELVEKFRVSLEKINPELTIGFDYMIKYDLYDISSKENKRPGGYTATLGYFGVPFIYHNPDGSASAMFTTLTHEYGHFNALFHSNLYDNPDMNLDISEIHSQGLELLMMSDYGRYYGNDSVYNRYATLIYTLDSIISASVYSMWLEDVYAEPDKLTRDMLCSKFRKTCEALGVEDTYLLTGLDCEWIMVPHNFEVPFYYISYGVSALVSLELFSEFVTEPDRAVDRYMKLSAQGSSVPFAETLEKCGFSNPFAESTFHKVCKAVKEYTGTGFNDVKEDDWFYPYVIKSAYFLDGTAPDKFSPQSPATRLTFVDAIGRMEEDINGIAVYKSAFSDTDSKYVGWAKAEGIASGISEGEFSPQSPVTREMVVCFLHRLAGKPKAKSKPGFSDSGEISSWAIDAVCWASECGIVSGYTDNTFRPKEFVTHGETAKLIADTYKTNYKGD